jgi:hypothetical protein
LWKARAAGAMICGMCQKCGRMAAIRREVISKSALKEKFRKIIIAFSFPSAYSDLNGSNFMHPTLLETFLSIVSILMAHFSMR